AGTVIFGLLCAAGFVVAGSVADPVGTVTILRWAQAGITTAIPAQAASVATSVPRRCFPEFRISCSVLLGRTLSSKPFSPPATRPRFEDQLCVAFDFRS